MTEIQKENQLHVKQVSETRVVIHDRQNPHHKSLLTSRTPLSSHGLFVGHSLVLQLWRPDRLLPFHFISLSSGEPAEGAAKRG